MAEYDASHFNPPAPVASVTLRNPQTGATISEVLLLLDTGADVTLLPRRVARDLGIEPLAGKSYELIGFDGNKSSAQAVSLEMVLTRHAFRGQYLLIEGDRGIRRTRCAQSSGSRAGWPAT